MSIVLNSSKGPQSLDSPIEFVLQKCSYSSFPKALRNSHFALKWAVKECFLLSLMSRSV